MAMIRLKYLPLDSVPLKFVEGVPVSSSKLIIITATLTWTETDKGLSVEGGRSSTILQ